MFSQAKVLSDAAKSGTRVLDFFTGTLTAIGSDITSLVDSYRSYDALKLERDALRYEIKEMKNLRLKIAQLDAENSELRNQLGLTLPEDYPYLQAEIISQDPDNWFRTIIINKGSEDGVEPHMPVIAIQAEKSTETEEKNGSQISNVKLVQGVIGKIVQVNKKSARILPIVDQYSRLGVKVKKTAYWALLIGRNPYKEKPLLEYLSLSCLLRPGDEIVTSGGDGIFPKGLPIGLVDNFIERGANYQKAEIRPLIDMQRLDYVFVIQKKPETEKLEFEPLGADTIKSP
ncbi:MAG: rod shape-determining protein MreC [Spirochaetia bacterium]|nr:rod shape-determining protein MreC [Spirochaetia bacterium]